MFVSFPTLALAEHPTPSCGGPGRAGIQNLLRVFESIEDPRQRRGRRYGLPLLLALTVLAVTAGAQTFTEIAEYSADLPPRFRTWLGIRSWTGTPSGWTFARILGAIDHDVLERALSAWSRDEAASRTVALDGKTMRGAATGQASMPRQQVVAAMNERGEVLGQTTVDSGNENAATRTLLTQLGAGVLSGAVVTADAKHTGTAFTHLAEAAGACWLLPIKGNQSGLHARLRGLPWSQAATSTHDRSRGHGRAETRGLKILTLDADLRTGLLGARQAIRIRRWRQHTGQAARIETVHYLTDLDPKTATPDEIAQLIRGHWGIENRLHHVRDTTWNEDGHQARTGHAPPNLAALRNAAITLLRRAGTTQIRPTLRALTRRPERLLDLLPGNRQTT